MKRDISPKALVVALVALVGVRLALLPLFPLLDSSEGRYSLIPLVMVQTGNWVTPSFAEGMPYLAKPPLSFWLTAVSLNLFGASEFAARLPELLLTIASSLLVFAMSLTRGRGFALVATAMFASMGYVFFLAGTVVPDVAFACSLALAMVGFWKAVMEGSRAWGYGFFAGVAASLLIKGPVGPVLLGLPLVAFATWQGVWRAVWTRLPWIVGTFLVAAVVIPWYVLAEQRSPGFLDYFIIGEHIQRYINPKWADRYGHGIVLPMGTIWLFALIGSMPWSLVALWKLAFRDTRAAALTPDFNKDAWLRFLLVWCGAQLAFFTIPRHILLTYAVPMLAPLAMLCAHVLWRSWQARLRPAFFGLLALGPALVAAFALAAHFRPNSDLLRTQHEVLGLKAHLAPNDRSPLLYVPEAPFSAAFYGGSAVIAASDWASAGERLGREHLWVAVPEKHADALPAGLRAHLREKGRANGYRLFEASAPEPRS